MEIERKTEAVVQEAQRFCSLKRGEIGAKFRREQIDKQLGKCDNKQDMQTEMTRKGLESIGI